ncbi:hypothetical protein [Streptomyces sp. NPDC005336]|uniref:hypothetical protein n=1 Tax=Streptomyces sp. NPDC005336 TaxID=3157035 RepID=UPI0033A9DBB7
MKWSLIRWEQGAIELGWVVVEEGNTYRLRKLTKDGDDNAVIYVDQAVMNVLKRQKERQEAERARLGSSITTFCSPVTASSCTGARQAARKAPRRSRHGGAPCAPVSTCPTTSVSTTGGTARSRTIWKPERTP